MLDWPGNSLGNSIENIWAYLKRAMQQIQCNYKEQLWKPVQHHWYSLNQKLSKSRGINAKASQIYYKYEKASPLNIRIIIMNI